MVRLCWLSALSPDRSFLLLVGSRPRMPVPLEGSRVSNRNAASYTLPIRLSADTRQTSTVQFLWTNLSFGDFVALPFQNSPGSPSCVLLYL